MSSFLPFFIFSSGIFFISFIFSMSSFYLFCFLLWHWWNIHLDQWWIWWLTRGRGLEVVMPANLFVFSSYSNFGTRRSAKLIEGMDLPWYIFGMVIPRVSHLMALLHFWLLYVCFFDLSLLWLEKNMNNVVFLCKE